MNVLGNTTALQVLRGKIRGLNALKVDRTLSVEGASADAKATGDAIAEVKNRISKVDNTSDMDKPVSTAQAQAIADAKKAGTDAQETANQALVAANSKSDWLFKAYALESAKWDGNQISITCAGVAAVDVDQPIFVNPAPSSRAKFNECDIYLSGHDTNLLWFDCANVPDTDIIIEVFLFTVPETSEE